MFNAINIEWNIELVMDCTVRYSDSECVELFFFQFFPKNASLFIERLEVHLS
jgi:hypothetical protein